MYDIEKEICSIEEYITFIHGYRINEKTELWYRGHRDNMWALESSINREKRIDFPKLKPGEVSELRYKNVLDFKKELDAFIYSVRDGVPSKFNRFHYMFLGQHYGLKTPALDWTTDPLVALFFAINEYKYSEGIFPVVFILKPSLLNEYSRIQINKKPLCESLNVDLIPDPDAIFEEWLNDLNNTPFVDVPLAVKSDYDISYRISRQSGVFTLMDLRRRNFPWIQTLINGETFGITLKIHPGSIESMLANLETLNITKKTIYGADHEEWDDICKKVVIETPTL